VTNIVSGGNSSAFFVSRTFSQNNFLAITAYGSSYSGQSAGVNRAGLTEMSANNATGFLFRGISSFPLYFSTADNVRMSVGTGGDIGFGIGTTTPSARIDVRSGGATSLFSLANFENSDGADILRIRSDGKNTYWATNTAAGTTGAQTINRPSGTVNFAAGATSLVVTNSLCSTSSIVFAVVRTNDTTADIKNVEPGAGQFTIRLNAAATAETSVGFFIIN
jgi:hypothetical protein